MFATATVPGFGWRTFRVAEGEGPAPPVPPTGTGSPTSTCASQVDPADGTLTIEADGVTSPGATATSTAATVATPTTTPHPTVDTIVDRPESVRVDASTESGPVRARASRSPRRTDWPTHAVGDERSCARRSDDDRHRRDA